MPSDGVRACVRACVRADLLNAQAERLGLLSGGLRVDVVYPVKLLAQAVALLRQAEDVRCQRADLLVLRRVGRARSQRRAAHLAQLAAQAGELRHKLAVVALCGGEALVERGLRRRGLVAAAHEL
jgi:hypothetical protein